MINIFEKKININAHVAVVEEGGVLSKKEIYNY